MAGYRRGTREEYLARRGNLKKKEEKKTNGKVKIAITLEVKEYLRGDVIENRYSRRECYILEENVESWLDDEIKRITATRKKALNRADFSRVGMTAGTSNRHNGKAMDIEYNEHRYFDNGDRWIDYKKTWSVYNYAIEW